MIRFTVAPAMGAVLALTSQLAQGTIYYVDADTAWTTQVGSVFYPFKNIAQVNAASLLSGDKVLFRCSRSWPASNEKPTTLQLKPGITYSSYYINGLGSIVEDCGSDASNPRPILRGSIKLSSLTWTPDSANSNIYWTDLSANSAIWNLLSSYGDITQLIDLTSSKSSKRLQRARHPNIGSGNYYSAPSSQYLHLGAGSGTTNSDGSVNIALDPNAPLPVTSPAINLAGAQAFVRNYNWLLSRFKVTSQTGTSLKLTCEDPNHQCTSDFDKYNLGGYWLENQRWMLDSAGEWYYDKATHRLYMYQPNTSGTYYAVVNNFGITAGMGRNSSGADVIDTTKIANQFTVKNLEVQDTALDGVAIMGNPNDTTSIQPSLWAVNKFTLDNLVVTRAGRYGIASRGVNGISGTSTNNIAIKNTAVRYSFDSGIDLSGQTEPAQIAVSSSGQAWTAQALGVDVKNNSLVDIGMERFALAAIRVGGNSNVVANTISNAVSRGIDIVGTSTTVSNNVVQNSCARIDDCGGIYTVGRPVNNLALNIGANVVQNVGGTASADGRSDTNPMGNIGIYLDDWSSNVTVTGNSVTGADIGIHLHGATQSVLTGNMVDLSRQTALMLAPSASGGPTWETAGNQLSGNTFLTRIDSETPAVRINTGTGSGSSSFAVFSNNLYGSRTATPFWDETSTRATIKLNMTQWQSMGRDTGNTGIYADVPQYDAGQSPTNLVLDGDFNSVKTTWASDVPSAQTATYLISSAECYGNGSCLRLDNTQDWVAFHTASQQFAVTAGQTYLLVFDARSNQVVNSMMVKLNRVGSAGDLSNWTKVGIGMQWKRYSTPLVATASSVNSDGRLDLITHAGSSIYLDNVRLVPVTVKRNPETAPVFMVFNASGSSSQVACGASVSTDCSKYRDFNTGTSITFPVTLPAWGHQALYLDPNSWRDIDGDGVPESVDKCLNTPAGAGANESGCGVGQ